MKNGYSMTSSNWQLNAPIDAIVFDCDGTLTQIEGIDELAKKNGVGEIVSAMTKEAMQISGLNPALYRKRLELIYPTAAQLLALGADYFFHITPDTIDVINILQRFNKKLYILSAGLFPAIKLFAAQLNIPIENIFAVDIFFDRDGNYQSYEDTSVLTTNDGKRQLIQTLRAQHSHILHIGDGLNDLVCKDLVTRFVGFGGVFYRANIAANAHYYLKQKSLRGLLPLTLTADEVARLTTSERIFYNESIQLENHFV